MEGIFLPENLMYDMTATRQLLFFLSCKFFSAFESQSDFEVPHPYHSNGAEKL